MNKNTTDLEKITFMEINFKNNLVHNVLQRDTTKFI